MLSSIRGLLFDLDGTLIDPIQDIALSVNLALQQLHLEPLSTPTIQSYVGDGAQVLIQRALGKKNADHNEAALALFKSFYKIHCLDSTKLYPDVAQLLHSFSQHYSLFVVSNKPQAFCQHIIDELGISSYFKRIIGGDELEDKKPAALAADEIKQSYALQSEELLMIGDHHVDIRFAHNASMRSVFCNYGLGHLDGLTADYEISQFKELSALLLPSSS